MSELTVRIELNGTPVIVGEICGNTPDDACFAYANEYLLRPDATPISVSLPLTETPYPPDSTAAFFEGLLPEGFTRREVARKLHADENNYLSILSKLGNECIGALQIQSSDEPATPDSYEKLSATQIRKLAEEGATKAADIMTKTHLSLAGASGKVGLYYDDKKKNWYLPHGDAPSTHIVKQSHVRLNDIVINERLVMLTAEKLGIDVARSSILNTGKGTDSEILFITERYDRTFSGSSKTINNLPRPFRLHQEDMAQSLGIPSSQKYETSDTGYMKKMFDVIRQNAADPISDQLALWDRIVFSILIGNTDAHLKNYSLLYDRTLKTIKLAPAYDMISTTIYDESTRNMSFFIGGEIALDRINSACLERAARDAGIGKKIAMQHYDQIASNIKQALKSAADQMVAEGFPAAEKVYDQIKKRL
ncbi:MAG: type II toxin-antitoxin system HipA family toxin [Eubacterium sp.]|nr:type II toxin-antitoxin system HipA family toxin [Eubacterium sp.]